MKKYILLFVLIISTFVAAQKNPDNPKITSEEIKEHLEFLASDAMKGRFSGSPEERKAGNYIMEDFKRHGLKPAFNGSYFQEFPFIEKVELTKNNSLKITIDGKSKSYVLDKDFITAPFSGKGNFNCDLVFVGYGISTPKMDYDDYNEIDVKGKMVVVMRYHPEHDSSRSQFDKYSSFRQKVSTAKDKGAAGIIFVNGYVPKNDEDPLMTLHYDGAPGEKDFPALQIKRDIADELFKAEGLNFAEVQKQIDNSKKPSSFEFKNIKVSGETETNEVEKTARNVGGVLEGNDPVLKNEYIVIGGHYDHLGIDQLMEASMYKGKDPAIYQPRCVKIGTFLDDDFIKNSNVDGNSIG